MSDREASTWDAVRARGRRRYILMSGVLGWGLPMAFGVVLGEELLLDRPGPFLGRLAISLVMFLLGGFWFGRKMWADNERRYVEWRRQGKTAPPLVESRK